MARALGFGIIGCGEIAVATAQGITDAPNARIVRTMDVREELARLESSGSKREGGN